MRPSLLYAYLGLSLFLFVSCRERTSAPDDKPAQRKIQTLHPESRTLTEAYSCIIVGNMDVAIRPKITAFIEKQHINEGDFVHEGQLLFTLEDVQIKAAMNVAEANIQVAAAQMETAELTLKTKEALHQRNIISDYDLQLARNDVKVKASQLAQAQAQLVNAEREFAYTRITSPTDGIVGVVTMSPGNLISPTSEKALTQISQISVMRAYFSMSERQALALSRQYGTFQNMIAKMPPIQLRLSDGSLFPHKGKLMTVSGSVDASTGAIRARVNFPNPEYSLKSGYTGTILIPYTVDSVFVIPQNATFEIQNRRFVYVLDTASLRVKSRAIEIHPLNDGLNFIVLDGLKSGEQIVTEGAAFLKEDQRIEPLPAANAEASTPVQRAGTADPKETSNRHTAPTRS